MNKLLVLAFVALLGCGSDNSGGAPTPDAAVSPLVGTWLDVVGSTDAIQLTFAATTWKYQYLAQMTSGSYGVDIDSGTYTVSGDALTLTITASSCQGVMPTTSNTKHGTFTRQGNSLQLTMSTTLLAFQLETAPPSGMGAAIVGCFDNSGTFTAHAVTSVP